MKKYNVKNYIRYKEDVKYSIKRIPHKDFISYTNEELKILFPNKNIPMPIYFKTHYWTVGAHHWKPGYNSNYISKKILNPLKNIYICGESFSQKQAWIEGGLETANEVAKII